MVYLSKGSFFKLQWSVVGLSEEIIPDARYARQILARRQWWGILNGSSMEEMKDYNVVVRFHCVERVKQD